MTSLTAHNRSVWAIFVETLGHMFGEFDKGRPLTSGPPERDESAKHTQTHRSAGSHPITLQISHASISSSEVVIQPRCFWI